MTKAEELRSRAAKALSDARKIKDDAERDGGFNGEAREKVERAMAEFDELMSQAELEERMSGADSRVAPEERGRRLPEPTSDEESGEDEEREEVPGLIYTQEYRDAFVRFARYGDEGLSPEDARTLRQGLAEARALSGGVDADGGYLAPPQLMAGVVREAQDLEQLAPRMNTINASVRAIQIVDEADAVTMEWVAELGQKPEDQPTFSRRQITAYTGAVIVRVSDELLEDTTFGLEAYLSTLAAEGKVELEEAAFVNGNGTGKPRGILNRLNGESSTPNRFTTAGIGTLAGDDFVRALYALAPRYRRNATWILGTNAIIAARLLKDGNDNYIWQPGLQAGEPSSILGRPVVESVDAALNTAVSGGNDVGVVGDLRRYTVLRRLQLQVKRLEELYAETDEVGFRFRFRTGGDVQNTAAFRSIRVRAS